MASSPVITTKFIAPHIDRGMIDRPRVLQLVSMAHLARLIVITAPAGTGKTSFAAAWLAQLRTAGDRTAWLTIDSEDDEPARFLHYVTCALHGAIDGVDPSKVRFDTQASLAVPNAIVSAMINHLTEVDDAIFLVLDDFHCLTDRVIHEAVSLLVAHAPSNFHLVLTTRQQPPLSLARLRANGELLEIDTAALRFDVDETRRFLSLMCGRQLASATISRLYATTEGWAAALRLAAAGIRRDGSAADVWAGPSRPFAAYLEEMLASWPDDTVDFMTRASVLDSMSSDLCQKVTGVPVSGELLESVARRHLLLESVGDDGKWFRFHQLLHDYLRQRLRARHPDEEPHLHRHAFTWYAEHEMWTDAARHAIAAGDIERAVEWISHCGMTLVRRGDLLTLLGWQRQLPAEVMRGQVKLRLAIAWGMTLAMRSDEAQAMLEQVELDTRAQTTGQERDGILWECRVLRAVILGVSDDSMSALTLCEECIRQPCNDPWNTNVLANVLRFARWKAGDIGGIYATPWIPYSLEQDRRNVFSSVYRHYMLSMIEMDRSRFDLAEREAREALRLAETHVGPHSIAAGFSAPILAELSYERNQFDEAESLLVERLPTIDLLLSLEGVRIAYTVLVRIAASRANIERAHSLLGHAEALGYHRKWDRLVSGVLLERTRLLLGESRFAEASACVGQLERLAELNPVTATCARSRIRYDRDLARGELAFAHNRWAEAVDLLEGLRRDVQTQCSPRLMMQLKAKLAIALMASNENDGALLALRDALELAMPAAANRSILDAGRDIGPLLERFRTSSRCPRTLEPYVERLLTECRDAVGRSKRIPAAILSRREVDILNLIDDGLSNKEVARALGITPETVKTHLKNVFGKLSVERRTQAVAHARSLGLLE